MFGVCSPAPLCCRFSKLLSCFSFFGRNISANMIGGFLSVCLCVRAHTAGAGWSRRRDALMEKTHRSSIGADAQWAHVRRAYQGLKTFFFSGTGDMRFADTCQEDYTSNKS